ncbi:MAG: glycine cleavage system protein T [Alphaproteobacteria bacterium]|nr:glycine cleavage system protein T [Alphaproteobacteria bacterium]
MSQSFGIALGPRIRKSPFFNSTVKAGVSHFTTYNHMYMPVSYGDLAAEYDRLINGVAMWDVAAERQVCMKGPDAIELARLITPRNLDKLVYGMGRYIPMCNSRGTLINDPVLQKISEDEGWISIADSDMKFWCEALAVGKGMNVTVTEPDASPLAVQGPKAVDLISDVMGDWVRELKYFGFKQTELNGIPLLVARSGWSKQGGYELYLLDGAKGDQLWDSIAEAGEAYGIGPGAPNYIERVESGLISVNADTDDDANPFEMGMGKFIDLDQDVDYVGKAALKQIAADGPARKFCGVVMDGDKLASTNAHRWDIEQNGRYVGFASAAAYSPRLDQNIAVALITTEAAESGAEMQVMTDHGVRNAVATSLPFGKK